MSYLPHHFYLLFFFFNDTATTEIYTLSLHDALPIFDCFSGGLIALEPLPRAAAGRELGERSEEHTSELQSLTNLVCRLLLEKKKKNKKKRRFTTVRYYTDWIDQQPEKIEARPTNRSL